MAKVRAIGVNEREQQGTRALNNQNQHSDLFIEEPNGLEDDDQLENIGS